MDPVQIEVKNLREVEDYLDDLPENTFDDAKGVFATAITKAHRKVQMNLKWRLHKRSGMLARSIQFGIKGTTLESLRASIYSVAKVAGLPVAYAPMQEFGGTVNAIRAYMRVPGGPYLNIPTKANRTPAGVMRLPAKEVFARGGYIAKTGAGNWGVFIGSQMMFVLKKRVHIPARLGMRKAAADQIPTILSSLQRMIGKE